MTEELCRPEAQTREANNRPRHDEGKMRELRTAVVSVARCPVQRSSLASVRFDRAAERSLSIRRIYLRQAISESSFNLRDTSSLSKQMALLASDSCFQV